MSKLFALCLLLLLVFSSLVMAESVYSQTIPKPSVPEFSLKYVDNSYDVPPTSPTYTIDPYTGKQMMIEPSYAGYHVDNRTIELWIKNQPYVNLVGSSTYHLYYDVRTKGHFEQDWFENNGNAVIRELASVPFTNTNNITTSEYISNSVPLASNSDYTLLYFNGNLQVGSQMDFQVKAILGHDSQFWEANVGIFEINGNYVPAIAYDSESDWSLTQTFVTPSATDSEKYSLVIIFALTVLVLAVVVISSVLYVRHLRRNTSKPDNSTP